jgi:fucose 4-O-acetylase-like acetyltransferase
MMGDNVRVAWVDYAKAIGIILVVYGHVARGVVAAGIEMPKRFFELTDSIIYSFHMPLFFFLAGMFFFKSYERRRNGLGFALSKVDTILYPYVLWSLLQGSIEAALSNHTNGTTSFADILSLVWEPRAQFWFLYALFLIFILAAIIFAWVPKRAALAVFAVSTVLYVFQSSLPQGYVFAYISSEFVFFMLGVVFEMYAVGEMFFRWTTLAALLVFAVLSQFLFHVHFGLTYLHYGLGSLIVSISSLMLVINISHFLALRPYRLVLSIGGSSMAIFLMHVVAGSGVRIVLQNVVRLESYVPHLIMGTAAGIFGPLLVLLLFRKAKFRYAFSAPVSRLLTASAPDRA